VCGCPGICIAESGAAEELTTRAAAEFAGPGAIAVDDAGTLYVAGHLARCRDGHAGTGDWAGRRVSGSGLGRSRAITSGSDPNVADLQTHFEAKSLARESWRTLAGGLGSRYTAPPPPLVHRCRLF
jgi:hypothetical protein